MFCPLNKPKLNEVKIQVLLDIARCLICKKNSTTVQYKSEDTVTCVPHSLCITGKQKQVVAVVLHHHKGKRWNLLAEDWLSPLKMRESLSKNILGPLLTLSFRRISYVVISALNFNLLDWEWIHSYSRICEGRQKLTSTHVIKRKELTIVLLVEL